MLPVMTDCRAKRGKGGGGGLRNWWGATEQQFPPGHQRQKHREWEEPNYSQFKKICSGNKVQKEKGGGRGRKLWMWGFGRWKVGFKRNIEGRSWINIEKEDQIFNHLKMSIQIDTGNFVKQWRGWKQNWILQMLTIISNLGLNHIVNVLQLRKQ